MIGPLGFSDAARRISDAINQALVDGHRNQWMAFALQDGTTDGKTYQSRADAVRFHTNRARLYMYIRVPWDGCTPRAADVYLKLHRQLAEIGQHPIDDLMPDTQWMFDNRREALPPSLDRRQLLTPDERATRARRFTRMRGLYLPRG